MTHKPASLLLLLVGVSACTDPDTRIVAKVGDSQVTVKDVRESWKAAPHQGQSAERFARSLLAEPALVREAERRGIEPTAAAMLRALEQEALAEVRDDAIDEQVLLEIYRADFVHQYRPPRAALIVALFQDQVSAAQFAARVRRQKLSKDGFREQCQKERALPGFQTWEIEVVSGIDWPEKFVKQALAAQHGDIIGPELSSPEVTSHSRVFAVAFVDFVAPESNAYSSRRPMLMEEARKGLLHQRVAAAIDEVAARHVSVDNKALLSALAPTD